MIEHLDRHNDEAAITALKARLQSVGIADADQVSAELSAHRIQARDRAFGAEVTMNLLGELTDISLTGYRQVLVNQVFVQDGGFIAAHDAILNAD